MTDHNNTYDDVIETLKNAKYKVDGVVTRGYYLSPETFNAVVDLIGRQEAKIEEKSKNITFAAKELIRLDRERSEVIKEFAENVKAIFECVLYFDDDVKECILNEIDELVKEMTEGNHESQST